MIYHHNKDKYKCNGCFKTGVFAYQNKIIAINDATTLSSQKTTNFIYRVRKIML